MFIGGTGQVAKPYFMNIH